MTTFSDSPEQVAVRRIERSRPVTESGGRQAQFIRCKGRL